MNRECLARPPYIEFVVCSAINRQSSRHRITRRRAHKDSIWMLCSKHQNREYRMNLTADVWLTVNWAQLRHTFVDASPWHWLLTRSEKIKDQMQQHAVTDLKSLSIAVFLGNAITWNSSSEWGDDSTGSCSSGARNAKTLLQAAYRIHVSQQ